MAKNATYVKTEVVGTSDKSISEVDTVVAIKLWRGLTADVTVPVSATVCVAVPDTSDRFPLAVPAVAPAPIRMLTVVLFTVPPLWVSVSGRLE